MCNAYALDNKSQFKKRPIPISKILNHQHSIKSKMIINPSAEHDGLQKEFCTKCAYKKYKKYLCAHNNTEMIISKVATCTEEGRQEIICKDCKKVLKSVSIPIVEHRFSDWQQISNTKMNRTCNNCKKIEEKEIFTQNSNAQIDINGVIKNNSIYIPRIGMNASFSIAELTQSAVNQNDIICGYAYAIGYNEDDPFILGHNYGTMKLLKGVLINDYIYININGQTETYQVVISELGQATDDEMDIIGLTTGTSIYQSFGTKTLHLYTCDNGCTNGRWMVLAKKI